MSYTLGLRKRSYQKHAKLSAERPFDFATSDVSKTIIQPLGLIHNQLGKGSCVGQAVASILEAAHDDRSTRKVSAVDLWIDARRRQHNIEGSQDGTSFDYAVESVIRRGWSAYRPGEDEQPEEQDRILPSLTAELEAADDKPNTADVQHYMISLSRAVNVITALSNGFGVGIGTGVRDAYFAPPKNTVLGKNYLDGTINYNGHEQRIFAWFADMNAFGVQNSWGEDWSEFSYAGKTYKGCCLVQTDVILQAWDVDALKVVI